jgi:hypothetical protein
MRLEQFIEELAAGFFFSFVDLEEAQRGTYQEAR